MVDVLCSKSSPKYTEVGFSSVGNIVVAKTYLFWLLGPSFVYHLCTHSNSCQWQVVQNCFWKMHCFVIHCDKVTLLTVLMVLYITSVYMACYLAIVTIESEIISLNYKTFIVVYQNTCESEQSAVDHAVWSVIYCGCWPVLSAGARAAVRASPSLMLLPTSAPWLLLLSPHGYLDWQVRLFHTLHFLIIWIHI